MKKQRARKLTLCERVDLLEWRRNPKKGLSKRHVPKCECLPCVGVQHMLCFMYKLIINGAPEMI